MILLKDILQGNIQDQIQKLSNAHFLDNLIQNFQLNVTSLNKFLECPLKFFYESLLRVPQAENELSVYGQAIHFALKKMGLAKKEGQSIQVHEVYEAFEWYLLQKKYFFSNDHLSAYLDKGKNLLEVYYDSCFPSWPEVKEVEQHIQVTWNNIPLKGILDKLQVKDGQIQVVDYKTGKYKNANPKLRAGNGMQDHLGGDYWRQAIFYHLLLRSQNVAVDKVIFEFVEPDDQQSFQQAEVCITPDQVEVVEAQIQDMWRKLQNREFTPCLKQDCTWCQFHQHHQFSPDVWTASEEV
ncbi:MAG: PD-(D/E)XK nuclease family protein [Thermoflavifilum sp.]|nr:PD-(D/E)XK nuclease family protein [Thermoflavifilum sp.]